MGSGWALGKGLRWPMASLRSYLHVIMLAAVLPLALFTAWLISWQVTLAHQQLHLGLREGANALALMIEREHTASVYALQRIATDPQLLQDDSEAVHGLIQTFQSVHPSWSRLSLRDLRNGTVFPAPLSDGPEEADDLALHLARHPTPQISGLLPGSKPGRWWTRIAVPVVRGGEVRYVLAADIEGRYWQELIRRSSASENWLITLYDSSQTVVAQSRDTQAYTSDRSTQPTLPVSYPPDLNDAKESATEMHSGDDVDTYVAWQNVPVANWGVRVGVDAAALNRQTLIAWLAAAVAGLLSLAAGMSLSRVVTSRVTRPLGILAQSGASSLADKDTTVFEIAMLRNAMLAAEIQRDTARQRLEAKATEFETLFELSPVGLSITLDTEGKKVWRNRAKIALFDLDSGGPQTFDLVCDGRVLPLSDYPLQRAARGERIHNLELDVHHHDGRVLRVLAHAAPLLDAENKPRGSVATFVDITEQVHANAKLKLAQAHLEDNQQFIELAQKAGDVGFFDYAVPGNCITMTSGLSLLSGLGEKDVTTTWEGWLSHLNPVDAASITAQVVQVWQARQEQLTVKIQHHDGTADARWLSCRAVCMYDDQGQPLRMIGAVVDVTAQQQREQKRGLLIAHEKAARHEAEKANRAKDEFLAVLGHELRNPLGAITAGLEVLNRISSQDEQPARVRMIVTRQARHLARLMDDLLDVARIIAGKIQLSLSPVNLHAATQKLLTTLTIAGLTQPVEVEIEDVWVQADPVRLEQIINNLITNASKYSPPDSPIRLVGTANGEMVKLQIINHGPGISPTLLPHVFNLFTQGERTIERRQGGLGIGLTLVKSLVDLHQGRIHVNSKGDLTVFTIELPAAQPAPSSQPRVAPAVVPCRKILIIEDNDDARDALRMMLETKGHDVEARADSLSGLQVILDWQPHLALVDIGLSGISGYEVARRAREAGFAGWLISLSGYGQQEDVQTALECGFDFHMIKPLDEQTLDDYLSRSVH